jgi:hypothetical protein
MTQSALTWYKPTPLPHSTGATVRTRSREAKTYRRRNPSEYGFERCCPDPRRQLGFTHFC